MSETPETDAVIKNVGDGPYIAYLVHFARKLERERDDARRELAETISCIEQAIDFHQVHHQSFQASAIKNLLENINQRRKHDPR